MTLSERRQQEKENYLSGRDELKYKVYDRLVLREGYSEYVYADSQDHLTVGVGHKLLPEELEVYKESDKWEDTLALTLLFVRDADSAFNQAEFLAGMLGHRWNATLVFALASVCFQLGNRWHQVHKRTWKALQQGDIAEAIKEVEDSLWFEQTPVRVRDFQNALHAFNEELNSNG